MYFESDEFKKQIALGNKIFLDYFAKSDDSEEIELEKESYSYEPKHEFCIKPFLTSGNPEYIEWCLQNLGTFYLYPSYIPYLEQLDTFLFEGFKINRISENIFEYSPLVNKRKFNFPIDDLIEKKICNNASKYELRDYYGEKEDNIDWTKGDNRDAFDTDEQYNDWLNN